jgi:hypothetical protein
MRQVSELYVRHEGTDFYVVGTGGSMRVFPAGFFENRFTVGLNLAWKVAPCTYSITIHPDLNVPEFMPGETARNVSTWITGFGKARHLVTPDQYRAIEETFYNFDYHGRANSAPDGEPSTAGRVIEWVRRPTADYLYVWSSISQAGANLAANLGARNVILVGCDNCALLENHHADGQHTRWNGADPNHRYRQYREGLAEVRTALRERGVNLVTLNPFLGLDSYDEDFTQLCSELGVARFLDGVDISPARGSHAVAHVSPIARLAEKISRRFRRA